MKPTVKTAAYGLLKSLTAQEVEELVEVLTYFNTHCKEDVRAECLRLGCKDPEKANPEERTLMEKTAGSTDIYLSGGQSVCPCCRR